MLFFITSTWEVSIEETSYVATIAVALRVGSFTSMYNYYFLFDVAITNSYILHKNFTSNTIRNVKQFRLQLAKELIGTYCSRKTSGRSCGLPRTLALQHFPLRICPQPSAKRCKRGRCGYCSQLHKSSWMCQECGVWLCHDGNNETDCFYLWHKSLPMIYTYRYA